MAQKSQKKAPLPDLWYKNILKKQSDLEEMRLAVMKQVNGALSRLQKKYHWDEAYLFGSVAQKGKFRQDSDIDIAVLGLNRLEHYAFTGEISDLLDKQVDVVLLEECRFAKSIKKKGLKWNRKTGL